MKNIIIVLVIAALAVAGYAYFKSSSEVVDTPTPSVSVSVSPSASPSRSVSPKPTASKSPAPTPSPTRTPGIGVQEVQIFNVNIQNMAFAPAAVTVHRGDVVVFRNGDATAHTVTSVQGSAFNSGAISANSSFTLATQDLAPGTYQYQCTFHPSMRGTVIVQ